MITINNAAAIVAIDEDGNCILKKEYRYCYDRDLIEVPAGTFEEDETDGLAVAKRELLEETGYKSDEWQYLGATVESSAKLTNYMHICSRRTQMKTMPEDPVTVKTIVTIDMAERIAAKYGVKTINVLTGFKFIGEQIGFLEKQGKEDSYIFGMEESYGYLSGSYVRDKDGVNAAFLICEMFTYYASQGIGLFEKLNELYAEYGYCLNTLHSYTFEGSAGFEKMQNIMVSFRKSITEFAGKKVLKCLDYSEGIDGLPKSDVLKFFLEDNCSIVVRPSGTEPKLKAYISVSATTKEEAQVVEGKLARAVEEKM